MKLVLAIDFDGTIAQTEFPLIIGLMPHAKEVLTTLHDEGHIIVINSCRINKPAEMMQQFLDEHGIPYHHINENPPHRTKMYDGDSRKISADIYIDDHNLGCKMIYWPEVYEQIQSYVGKEEQS